MHRSFPAAMLLATLIALPFSGPTQAAKMKVTFTVDFEDGVNHGGWSFGGSFYETIEQEGGNPGRYLHNTFLDTFAAQPRTLLGFQRTIFHGDYRARNVTFVGIDLAVFGADFTTQGRPLSVILVEDGGTPGDLIDDCRVYRVGGHPTPLANGVWQPYRFRIPSDSTTLPQGWAVQGCAGMSDDEAWNRVITGVDQLSFFTGDPALFFVFQVWDIGLDNPTIVYEPDPVFFP
jgi:hypothetical protein